jgi:hypothetical protein
MNSWVLPLQLIYMAKQKESSIKKETKKLSIVCIGLSHSITAPKWYLKTKVLFVV